MKTRLLACSVLMLLLGVSRSIAGDQTAQVTESYNHVLYGPSDSTVTTPAPMGTLIHDGQYLKTGDLSRAELRLPTESITRLGANTIFNYSLASNTIDLQTGTILFCKPKGDGVRRLNIKTAALTAGIVGTTGVVSVHKNTQTHQTTYKLYLVEGHVGADADGTHFDLHAGDVLEFTLPNKPFVSSFDLPALVKSPLFKKFKRPLPNQKYIDEEVARYNDDVSRGFIQPGNQTNTNYAGVPTVPTTAFDSAQNSQGGQSPGDQPSKPRSGP